MRKQWRILAAGSMAFLLGLAAYLYLTLSKQPKPLQELSSEEEVKRKEIRAFWALFNQANDYRVRGQFQQAAAAYQGCLKLDPKHEDSLYYLGSSLEEQGDYEGAVAAYRRLVEQNGSSGRALSELSSVLASTDPGAPTDFQAARAALLRSVEVNREQSGPFLRLGLLDLNQRRLESALHSFRLAAEFGAAEGYYWTGYVLFLQHKYSDAIPSLLKVLEMYARERKISGRGVSSEGDLWPAPDKPMTELLKAALESIVLLRWSASRLGGYPPGTPKEFRLASRPAPEAISGDWRKQFAAGPGRPVWADYDLDGRPDYVLVGPGVSLSLHRNDGAHFSDVTATSGLKGIRDVKQAYWVDYNGDGLPDLYFVRGSSSETGGNRLFRNNGDGTVTEVTKAAGLGGKRSTVRACIADFEGDGRPDIVEVGSAGGGNAALRYFRNVGKTFVETTAQTGLVSEGSAVDCAVADYDGDGKPDLFVLYWKRDAALFRNLGKGKFVDVTRQAGLEGIRGHGFNAIFFDYDGDGSPDLLITDYAPFEHVARCLIDPRYRATAFTPRLFRNDRGRFLEVTAAAGLTRCYGTMEAIAVDLDGDGRPDLIFANGSPGPQRLEPSVVLHNIGGRKFEEWSYFPAFDRPTNLIGITVRPPDHGEPPEVDLQENAISETTGLAKLNP